MKNKYLIFFLCFVPVLSGLLYVLFFGVNVVWFDQWEMIPYFDSFFQGKLTFSALLAQHNEHRIFFPRIVMLLLGIATSYNHIAELYVIQLLYFFSLFIIFMAVKNQFKLKTIPFWFVPVSFLLFSLRQWENMLFGFQITYLMVHTFALFTFYFLYLFYEEKNSLKEKLYFLFILISGVIASFSSAMGLFVWPVIIFLLIIMLIKKNKHFIYLILSVILSVLIFCLYFNNYVKPVKHPPLFNVLKEFYRFILFFLVSLGSPLSWDPVTSCIGGIIIFSFLICGTYFLLKNKRFEKNYFSIAIILFSLFNVLAVTVGRAGMGDNQALTARYTTFPVLLLIALYIMFIDLTLNDKRVLFKRICYSIVILIFLSLPFAYSVGIKVGEVTKKERLYGAEVLKNYSHSTDEALAHLYPSPEILKQRIPFLVEHHYSVFSDKN